MTPDDVAVILYDDIHDLLIAPDPKGILLPPVPVCIAVRLILDILDAHDRMEGDTPPERLGQAVAYLTERIRQLLPSVWQTPALDDAAAEMLRHTRQILGIQG